MRALFCQWITIRLLQMEMQKASTERKFRQIGDQIIDIITTTLLFKIIGSIQNGRISGNLTNGTMVDNYLLLSSGRENTSS